MSDARATDAVRRIADAVLYEGHMLFPYRLSALKNRQRWTFGGVYPPAYARANGDRSRVSFECLVEGRAPRCDVELRFLQIVRTDGRDEACERIFGVGAVAEGRLRGIVEAHVEELELDLSLLAVAVENTSTWSGGERVEALLHTFVSAHAVVHVEGGAFVSPRETTRVLRNDGLWPVLVGDRGDRSTLLASPIILDDYPQVAPESPGDFFDGGEIDQLLVLNILALPDAEKAEIRAGDPLARALLERTEAMSTEELLRLHGTWREP
jgi:hypothetical protein